MKIDIWHNIRWSLYKAGVFAAMARIAAQRGDQFRVFQICETETARETLGKVQGANHDYPHVLLFNRGYERIAKPLLWLRVGCATFASRADIAIVPGFHHIEYWLQAVLLAALGRKRAVFCDSTHFDRPQRPLKRLAKRIFFRLVPNVLCYGERARDYAIAHGAAPDRVFIRCQAANLPDGYDPSAIPALRRAHASPPEAPLFLYVGRLSAEKDLPSLLAAFDQLHAHCPAARLRLIGGGPDEARLRQQAGALASAAAIEFGGAKVGEDLGSEYLQATALILPSRSEPWGLVVNEALHFGCPVIVSDRCGCVPELVQDSDCGQVFECGNSAALAGAMEAMTALPTNPDALARRCLARIAPYTPQAAAEQTYAAIDTIMARA